MYRFARLLMLIGATAFVAGCTTIHFYHQAVTGQMSLMGKRAQTSTLLNSGIDPALRDRLLLTTEILAYAESIGLPSGSAYRSYVETGRPYVVWNVFATRPFSMTLKTSCFPVAGCVSYRGYFDRADAIAYAQQLEEAGYESYVGGVTAYSTLGWFDDPLLDTFLFQADEGLAALLFHELAHRLVYVSGDTRFNESLATTVENFALQGWLEHRGEPERFRQHQEKQRRQDAVIELVMNTRQGLELLYTSGLAEAEMQRGKLAAFRDLQEAYNKLRESWDEGEEFSAWMSGPMSNAKLETVADYHEWVGVLSEILITDGFELFKVEMSRLAKLSPEDRAAALGNGYSSR